jgi:hypothetical protein
MREKMAEERRKKLAMLDSKRKAQNAAEEMVMTENLDELGMYDIPLNRSHGNPGISAEILRIPY